MKHLLKIISQDINTLQSLVEHLQDQETLNDFEIDLALRKVNDINNELLMLKPKPNSLRNEPKTDVNVEPLINTADAIKDEVLAAPEITVDVIEPEESVVPEVEVKVEEAAVVDEVVVEVLEPEEEERPVVKEVLIPEVEETTDAEVEAEVAPEPIVEPVDSDIVAKEQEDVVVENEKTNPKSTLADRFNDTSPSVNDIQAGVNKQKYLAAQFKDKPIAKLSKAIKINDRIWFINELFNKDGESYTDAINKLDQMNNLDEALAFVFESYQWDQEKKSTIGFLELIFRRFAEQN